MARVAELIYEYFEILGTNLDCSILIDKGNRQDEAQAAFLLNQSALHALHGSCFDAYLFPDDEFAIGLNSRPTKIRAKKIDIGLWHRKRPLTIAYDPERTWGSQD